MASVRQEPLGSLIRTAEAVTRSAAFVQFVGHWAEQLISFNPNPTHLLFLSFDKHILSIDCVVGTVPRTGMTTVNDQRYRPPPRGLIYGPPCLKATQ